MPFPRESALEYQLNLKCTVARIRLSCEDVCISWQYNYAEKIEWFTGPLSFLGLLENEKLNISIRCRYGVGSSEFGCRGLQTGLI